MEDDDPNVDSFRYSFPGLPHSLCPSHAHQQHAMVVCIYHLLFQDQYSIHQLQTSFHSLRHHGRFLQDRQRLDDHVHD